MKTTSAVLGLLLLTTSGFAEIIDVTASVVLDRGSYVVDLIDAREPAIHLFIANPTRRQTPTETIWLLGENGEKKEVVTKDSERAKKLREVVALAVRDDKVPQEAKLILGMLDRLLVDPEIPWKDVHFPERWRESGEPSATDNPDDAQRLREDH